MQNLGFQFKPVKAAEAKRMLATLLVEGYLEPHEPEHKFDKAKYQTSEKGRRLVAANLTPRFDRARADSEVAALIARAKEINARDELVFFVHKITAFGSYLTNSNDLGDIDLVVELAPRRLGKKHTDESHYRARNSGKTLDFMASLTYGSSEVVQLLRARKPRLSFNVQSTLELKTEFRVLFDWLPDAERREKMEALDWRLHEPLRQVKEWMTSNPGLNSDPVEIARWCEDVAAMLSKPRDARLFHHWDDNAAHRLLFYWGVTAEQAAAEIAHGILWERYHEHVSSYITREYKKPVNALIEAEIYSHFTRDTDDLDAAILIAKHNRWKLIRRRDEWVSMLERRVEEMEGRD